MKVKIVTVGRIASKWIAEGEDDYRKRIDRLIDLEVTVVPDPRKRLPAEQQKEAEGRAILAALQPGDRVVLLDERGRQPTSRELAADIERLMSSSLKRLVLIIGGPYGFSQAVYDRADAMLALTRMTLTHEMARLLLTEQLYRALAIINHLPYHHD